MGSVMLVWPVNSDLIVFFLLGFYSGLLGARVTRAPLICESLDGPGCGRWAELVCDFAVTNIFQRYGKKISYDPTLDE